MTEHELALWRRALQDANGDRGLARELVRWWAAAPRATVLPAEEVADAMINQLDDPGRARRVARHYEQTPPTPARLTIPPAREPTVEEVVDAVVHQLDDPMRFYRVVEYYTRPTSPPTPPILVIPRVIRTPRYHGRMPRPGRRQTARTSRATRAGPDDEPPELPVATVSSWAVAA